MSKVASKALKSGMMFRARSIVQSLGSVAFSVGRWWSFRDTISGNSGPGNQYVGCDPNAA